jgi:hypothetical protein
MTSMETPGDSTPGAPEQIIHHPINNPKDEIAKAQASAPAGQDQDDWRELPARNFAPGELTATEEARRLELYAAAASCWGRGFRVIPLHHVKSGACTCSRGAECPSAGKHPTESDWTTAGEDPARDDRPWREIEPVGGVPDDWRPNANLGIVTGEVSGIFVVDIDPDHAGDTTFEKLAEAHSADPIRRTLIVQTGSGGRHYYFRHPGFRVPNSKPWGKASGIDIRGDGGMVVAPPSISGKGPKRSRRPARSSAASRRSSARPSPRPGRGAPMPCQPSREKPSSCTTPWKERATTR